MDAPQIALVAVSAATFAIDRPYSYRVPDSLIEAAVPGARVAVPFGRGNRKTEGVILSVAPGEPTRGLKSIESVLDTQASGLLLGEAQLSLALWMSRRFFCTVFDAIRAMLPAGVWNRGDKAAMSEKTVKIVTLAIAPEDALVLAVSKKSRAPMQSAVLSLLAEVQELSQQEITYRTGAGSGVFPALVKLGAIEVTLRVAMRRPAVQTTVRREIELNDEQMSAFETLEAKLNAPDASAALLYGVTGSGKTSIYIKLIECTLAAEKTAIVLVPEIALTPQLMSIFVSQFGDDVAVLHSGLTTGERFDEWKRIKNGEVKVAIGTRSAIFAPLENIGLIVIDEEQENTYKSESSPRYHARDVAKYRCAESSALLVLGSATPSIESMERASREAYTLVRLENRYNAQPLPEVIIADMKEELKRGNGGAIGEVLERELRENIMRGEQSILFLNRRGASSIVSCGECGSTFSCPNCDVSLTYHSANERMMCHYCGFSRERESTCTECGGKLKFVGAGTQKVEQELAEKFPGTKIIRMDADTVSAANPHAKILSEFRNKRSSILLGTQMVAKGLDFENVTLVGVVLADLSLYVNDYRAHERTFSLITQVVGRSGRGQRTGRAVIQTMTPDSEIIALASRQDYDTFFDNEIARRRLSGVPPARDLLTITITGLDETAVLRGAAVIRDTLRRYFETDGEISVLGPAPAAIARINNRFRYRVSVLGVNDRRMRDTIAHTVREFSRDARNRGVSVYADTDPF